MVTLCQQITCKLQTAYKQLMVVYADLQILKTLQLL